MLALALMALAVLLATVAVVIERIYRFYPPKNDTSANTSAVIKKRSHGLSLNSIQNKVSMFPLRTVKAHREINDSSPNCRSIEVAHEHGSKEFKDC